jgi:aldehyde dehydrogenase (NAD+)
MAYSRREPLGVVSVIVPWNFPFNVPWRKLGPALMAGNTAIFKPATQTPGVGEAVVQILVEAGLPPGVVQFVTGSGSELSEALVAHPLIRAITFTGSTEVGRRIAQQAARNFARTQLEMGGKNPMVVLRDADLVLASQDAVIGAFSCAGQWCTATSRLIVEEAVADDLLAAVIKRIQAIRLGPGTDVQSTMGPVAGEYQLRSVLDHLARAHAQGAQFATGGGRCEAGELARGCFIEPSLIANGGETLDVAREEIFGPVLTVFRVSDYAEALRLANAVPYGLSSSIYTRDLERALHFVEHTEVGLTHVNVHSAYKEPQQCFGGVKESGFGLPEAGSTGLQFFQEEKSIYIRKGPASSRV